MFYKSQCVCPSMWCLSVHPARMGTTAVFFFISPYHLLTCLPRTLY